jgi:hypothetical protein
MEYSDLIKSGIGAVIGFMLAQLVNIAKLTWERLRRPKLRIRLTPNNQLLSHSTQLTSGETVQEVYYGFDIRNVGKRIATGVRFQLLKIEYDTSDGYTEVLDTALDLSTYVGADKGPGSKEATIVPGAAVAVGLASWRGDYDVAWPLAEGVPDYYEETCGGARTLKFKVVAFDDSGSFVSANVYVRARG